MFVKKSFMLKKFLPGYFSDELFGYYEKREAQNLARWVIEDLTKKEALEIIAGPDLEWNEEEKGKIIKILEGLKQGDPIQYILGYTEFHGLHLNIEPGVLIPRNETEELVEWVLSEWKNQSKPCRVLDIGCGSGAIAIAIAGNLPEAEVYAVDISEKALSVCYENAKRLAVNLSCEKLDILNPDGNIAKLDFDVIISNPPYVLESQKPFLEKRVSAKEPALALFVPDKDPLVFYRAIADFASKRLRPGGKVYVEINDLLGIETRQEFDLWFERTELRQDINGKDRMIKASNGKK